jgi:hypothetical protein
MQQRKKGENIIQHYIWMQDEQKNITLASASSSAHHLLSVSNDKMVIVITKKHVVQERGQEKRKDWSNKP